MVKPTLGIIGGGQLGSMLAVAAKKLQINVAGFCRRGSKCVYSSIKPI